MEYSESPYLLHGFRNLPFIALILDEQLTIRHSSCLAEDRLHLGENHIGVHLQSYICAPINLSHILDGLNATSSCTLSLNLWNAEVKATFSKWTSEWTSGFNVVMEDNHSVVAQETLTKFEFLEAVLEHIGSAVFAVTADGRHALYNRQAGDCFGNMLPPPGAQNTEWVYKRWTARNPQTNEEVRLPLEQILSTGAHLKDVDVLITNNEEVGSKAVHSVVNGRPIDHNGKMVGAILLGLGYPEWRKRGEERLDFLFKVICEAMTTMMWIADLDGQVLWSNSKMADFSGNANGNVSRLDISGKIHPDDLESVLEHWDQANGKPYHVQYRMKNRHGNYRWIVTHLAPLRDPDTREIFHWIGSAVDIQEWKEADEQNRSFQDFITNGKLGNILYLTVDTDLRVTRCISEGIDEGGNFRDHHYVQDGLKGQKFVGRLLTDFKSPDYGERMLIYRKILNGELPLQFDEININGIHWQSIYTPITSTRNDQEIITGVAVFSFDVTALRNKEIELRQVEAERKLAERANQMKGEFLAKMSHELRTPLGAVIGMCDLLSKTPLNLEQSHFLRTVQKSADALMNVINHILDYEKIESGLMTIEEKLFSLEGMVDDIKAIFSYIIQSKHLEFIQIIEVPHHCHLIGDPNRTKQVLINLLNNAVKFTSSGRIVLSVHVREPGPIDNEAFVHFQVQDTGIGISPEAKQNLFKAFVQEDSSTARMYGGSGLGLCISKQLASLMKGSINLISEIGQGTTVNLEVPFRIPTPESIQTALNGQMTGHTKNSQDAVSSSHGPTFILVVEDNDINKEIIVRLLKGLGFWNLETASNGLEATSKIRKCQQTDGKMYDLILMDCQMPLMDGYETTKFIREHLPSKDLPIIALTANAIQGDRERCLEAGMSDYVTKPVTAKKLGQVILKWLQRPLVESNMDAPSKEIRRGEKRKEVMSDSDVALGS